MTLIQSIFMYVCDVLCVIHTWDKWRVWKKNKFYTITRLDAAIKKGIVLNKLCRVNDDNNKDDHRVEVEPNW